MTLLLVQAGLAAAADANWLDDQVAQDLATFGVPGAAVVEIRDGSPAHAVYAGFADLERGVPVSSSTVFNVGSVSKSLTAYGVVLLDQRGVLRLDSPVGAYLPGWRFPPTEYDAQQVTIERILSHTAGLSMWYLPAPPDPTWSLDRLLKEGRDPQTGGPFTIVAPPGTEVNYSGGGYALLQLAIERVTGTRFEDWAAQSVFGPLGMTHTRFVSWDVAASTMARGYDGWREPVQPEHQLALAEGGLTTTAEDLAHWVAEFCEGLAGAPSGPLDAAHLARMVVPMPGTQGTHGLGVVVTALPDGRLAVWHSGTNPGWDAMYYIVPAARDGIVVLTNGSEAGRYLAKSTICAWQRVENGVIDGEMCPPSTYAAVRGAYLRDGIDGAVARYRQIRRDHELDWNRHWRELNTLGYDLLKRRAIPDAVRIFKLNVEDHRETWEVYDSLGDGLERAGRRVEAHAAYIRAIKLDPEHRSRAAADRTARPSF